jgi:hypothetical protein
LIALIRAKQPATKSVFWHMEIRFIYVSPIDSLGCLNV